MPPRRLLFYYLSPDDKKARGVIPLGTGEFSLSNETLRKGKGKVRAKGKADMVLSCAIGLKTLDPTNPAKVVEQYMLSLEDPNEVLKWSSAIMSGAAPARPSRIPSLCTTFTRAGIEWRRWQHAVCMARPYNEPHHSGQAEP